MAIDPTPRATNQQLAGINAVVPMPRGPAPTLADGSPFSLSPNNSLSLGGATGNGYVITAETTPLPNTAGTIVVGSGGGTPAFGAQPAGPDTTNGVATAGTAAATTAATGTAAAAGGTSLEASGFGRADKNAPMRVAVGDGAGFSFPSFNATARRTTAPQVSWSGSWKRVEKDGLWYMEAPNGIKAIPAVEYRITPRPPEKVQSIRVANGWGKKFPDGTILVFDRTEGPYRLDPKGNKHKVGLGVHTFGGVRVRVFEAAVVRTLDPDGRVEVFDSRGNASTGTTRGRLSGALGSADAGASLTGGGKGATDSGPSTVSGGKPGTLAGGDGRAQLTSEVQRLTGVARGLLDEIRSGNVDPARLASLQAQLATLPAGILQAAGAAGTMTSDGSARVAGASGDGMPPTPGTTTATGGGAHGSPTPGVDANATTKQLPAGSRAKLDIAVPGELTGRQARFAQLPAAIQQAVAKAFGSDQGTKAFEADQLISFSASGEATLVEAGTVFTRHQAQVRGAGPGEDMALTVKPNRQPGAAAPASSGSGRPSAAPVTGGGARPASAAGNAGHSAASGAPRPASNVVTVGGGAASRANHLELFRPGGELRHVGLGGISGSFTWATLPAKAKAAILDYLRTETSDPAAKAFASRSGTGWSFDRNAVIVVEAGFAQFLGGLSMTRRPGSPAASRPPGSGAGTGPTSQPIGHDATRPPVSGGGAAGVGTVAPGTAPPAPVVNDPGEHGHVGHAH